MPMMKINDDKSVDITIYDQNDCDDIIKCMNDKTKIRSIKVLNNESHIVLPDIDAFTLDLKNTKNVILPKNIKCRNFDITKSDIKEIYSTHNLQLLYAEEVNSLVLPDDFSLSYLNILHTKNIKLPKNLKVRNLDIIYSDIVSIPDGTFIAGLLWHSSSEIAKFNGTQPYLEQPNIKSVYIRGYIYNNGDDIIKSSTISTDNY